MHSMTLWSAAKAKMHASHGLRPGPQHDNNQLPTMASSNYTHDQPSYVTRSHTPTHLNLLWPLLLAARLPAALPLLYDVHEHEAQPALQLVILREAPYALKVGVHHLAAVLRCTALQLIQLHSRANKEARMQAVEQRRCELPPTLTCV